MFYSFGVGYYVIYGPFAELELARAFSKDSSISLGLSLKENNIYEKYSQTWKFTFLFYLYSRLCCVRCCKRNYIKSFEKEGEEPDHTIEAIKFVENLSYQFNKGLSLRRLVDLNL